MPYPLPLTRTEAYLAYKAGVIQQSDLKPSLAIPRNGIDAWLAYWTGLAADYPKREDGTPHILQEEEAYIAYLCGVINEYPEKCLRRVGAYLRYLISARWGRPDHPLNREELYLSLIKTQFIPSGDPSSDIVIDGTAKAPFVDVKMYGDTFQHSYEGKNCVGFPDQDERTINGLTFSVKDGIVTVNGTAAATTFTDSSTLFNFKEAGDITLSIEILGGTQSNSIIGFQNRDSQAVQLRWQQVYPPSILVNKKAIDAETIAGTSDIRLYMNKDSVFNNFKFRLMAEYGSTATAYEPFVGGQKSPNPSYPQTIQTVTGKQIVGVMGKNLFDKDSYGLLTGYLNGTSGKIEASSGAASRAVYIPCRPNTTYTASKVNSGSNPRFCVFDTEELPADGVSALGYTGAPQGLNTDTSLTYTTKSTAKYLCVFVKAASTEATLDSILATLQIEAGSTATTYEPYSSNDYEINLGKNLFDISTASDVWINNSGVSQPNTVWKNSDFIKVEPNTTYTISGSTIEGGFKQFQYHEYSSNNESSYTNQYAQINGVNSTTFTTHTGCNYIRVGYRKDAFRDVQLEVGSTATTYAPYFAPIELCNFGTYQDYIWKDGEDWKIHKATAKAIFKDIEWHTARIGSTDHYRQESISIKTEVLIPTSNTKFVGACSGYTVLTAGETYGYPQKTGVAIQFAGYITSGNICVYDPLYDAPNQADNFKAARASTVIYYALATPTDTTITNQNLIDQLDALVSGGAENGTTYIKVNATDPDKPALLVVEAPKYE